VAIGYADGYPRSASGQGSAFVDGVRCPLIGRVSMDMTCFDVTDASPLAEGDMIAIDFDLARLSSISGRSQYDLLTGLGARYARVYQ
jgi:alanine racemase